MLKRFMRSLVTTVLLTLICAFTPMARAGDVVEVDVELVLAVDVSRSMTQRELEIQRRGYAEALVGDAVVTAIGNGALGKIALTYVEWGGTYWQRTIVDWTIVSGRTGLEAIASRLTAVFDGSFRRTSISAAIDYAAASFDGNGFTASRKIIDISGDGPNNQGGPVLAARARALAKGITINGLPLMTREGVGALFHLDDLDEYYRHCVTGGPASFVIPVTDWDAFPAAVRQKLVLELADLPLATFTTVAFEGASPSGYDCLIGEKMWQFFIKRYPIDQLGP